MFQQKSYRLGVSGIEYSNILKERNDQPRIIYPLKLLFKYEGEIQAFPDKS